MRRLRLPTMEDQLYVSYVNYLTHGVLPQRLPSTKSNFVSAASKFSLDPELGSLMRNGKGVLKTSELDELWRQLHNHSGTTKMWKRVNDRFYFRGGEKWVREKTRSCVACAHKNNSIWPAHISPLRPIKCTPKPFWRIHLDLCGPFPKSKDGNAYVGIAVCGFLKYVEAKGNFLFINIIYIIIIILTSKWKTIW